MRYLGREYSKRELMAYVGNVRQIVGIDRIQLSEGNGDSARLLHVRNGSGIEFDIIESRCMDMLQMSYKGIPINFLSKNGLFYPLRYLPFNADDSQKHLTGGMFYTCGTANVGWECIDDGRQQVNHGRIKSMSATNTSARGYWCRDDYKFEIYGEVRETSLFGENIALRRTITTALGQPSVNISDEIENEGFDEQPFMYMYHLNLGFPLVDRETIVYTSPATISARDDVTKQYISEYQHIELPKSSGREDCLMHDFTQKGQVINGAINERLSLGFYVKQDTNIMPYMHQWKTNIAGAYALGMEPSNCHCEGRVRERAVYGTLRTIKPFEKIKVEIEIGVIDGTEEIAQFKRNF